jgi:hypothetical protein
MWAFTAITASAMNNSVFILIFLMVWWGIYFSSIVMRVLRSLGKDALYYTQFVRWMIFYSLLCAVAGTVFEVLWSGMDMFEHTGKPEVKFFFGLVPSWLPGLYMYGAFVACLLTIYMGLC